MESSLSNSISFREPDGTLGYVILDVPGFTTWYSGTVAVNGSAVVEPILFGPPRYPAVFLEFGLPAGSNGSVTVVNDSLGVNDTQSSVSDSITILLAIGTYEISFSLPPGFRGSAASSSITVAGSGTPGATVKVRNSAAAGGGSTGLPIAEVLAFLAVAILGTLGAAFVVFRYRKPPAPPIPPSRAPDPPR
ncbi:MAG: hypothetical protein ACRECR_07250 [Thermoplasmata archaeon]